jgi:hypothetical protein
MTNGRNTALAILLAASALGAVSSASAGGFEGTVTQRNAVIPRAALAPLVGEGDITAEKVFAIPTDKIVALSDDPQSGARRTDAVIHVKGSKFRVDMRINDKPGFMIVDSADNRTWIVIPEEKIYLEWSKADREALAKKAETQQKTIDALRAQGDKLPADERARLEAALGPTPAPTTVLPTPAITKLEQSETINGMQATAHELRDGAAVSRGWLTTAHADLLAALVAASKSQQSVRPTRLSAIELLSAHGLPVRVQTLAPDYYEVVDMLKIEGEVVPDSEFAVPADYKKVDTNPTPAAATPAVTPAGP